MSHPDSELRRKLWELADRWENRGFGGCAVELREALTYPLATQADEAIVKARFGKNTEELADEAEGL